MDELRALPAGAAAAEAPHLLLLGDELGLVQLTRAAVAFIAQHYDDVTVRQTTRLQLAGAAVRGAPAVHTLMR